MKLKHIRVCLLACLLGCNEETLDPLATARVEIVSGDQQTGSVGGKLPAPVVVRVISGSGAPLSGVTVVWTVLEGGGTVDSVISITDSQGQARADWQLGLDIGSQALLARTATASVRLRAIGILGFSDVVGGMNHTCALSTTKQAYCWGSNDRGQLGNGTLTSSSRPQAVSLRVSFAALAGGFFHTCGVTEQGEVYCWGDNGTGQLGSGTPGSGVTSAVPRLVTGSTDFVAVSAGFLHTCAVTRTGETYCWGNDDQFALGGADRAPACPAVGAQFCTAVPQRVTGNFNAKTIAAGEFHSCATAADGAAFCWGWNSHGELGANAPLNVMLSAPARVFGSSSYAQIAAGARHTCALTSVGAPECWGRNGAGETGQVIFFNAPYPLPVATALRFRSIAAGDTHTCGLATDERAYCWGGELGDGSGLKSTTPVPVTLGSPVSAVGSGWKHACAVVNAEVWCWGSNSHGQLGIQGVARSNVPVRVQVGGS